MTEQERVLKCLAENPGWSNTVVAMELDLPRGTAQRYGTEARSQLGLRSSSSQCAVYIDRKKYEPLCRLLGVKPVEGTEVDKISGMQSGERVKMRDPTAKRRLNTKEPAPLYDERKGTRQPNELRRLVVRLRAMMRDLGYCRLTITPDALTGGKIVDSPI